MIIEFGKKYETPSGNIISLIEIIKMKKRSDSYYRILNHTTGKEFEIKTELINSLNLKNYG